MTSNTIQKELHLTHAQMIRFFQIRQDRSGIRSVRRMADALPDAHRDTHRQADHNSNDRPDDIG